MRQANICGACGEPIEQDQLTISVRVGDDEPARFHNSGRCYEAGIKHGTVPLALVGCVSCGRFVPFEEVEKPGLCDACQRERYPDVSGWTGR